MKKIILVMGALLAFFTASAQVKVDSGSPSIEMTLKRCLAQGDQVIMDFVVICRMNINDIYFHDPEIYDDEGNFYHGGPPTGGHYNIFVIDGVENSYISRLHLDRDIPRKLRLIVKHVDEYASSFLLIKMKYEINSTYYTATIKNLPINRE